ncbi:MAG: hypothetical protein AABZ60_16190 [Planctomycetota bacterium]
MKKKFWILFSLYFQIVCISLQLSHADQIYLKDGRVIQGTLVEDGDQYIIQMKFGKMKIKKSQVVRIEKEAEPPVKEEPKIEPTPETTKEPQKEELAQPTLTTDERIEKVLSQYIENLLKNLFEPKVHAAALDLLKESKDCRLIPMIFQKMEMLKTRNIETSLLLQKSVFKGLVDCILELSPEQQIPYEQLFGKGLKSSNPFVRVLSIYGLKQMNVFLLSHAQSILEDYRYDALYSYPHPKIPNAHYWARSEILLAIVPFADKITEENPTLVEKNLYKIASLLGGFSSVFTENPAAILLKKWSNPQTAEVLIRIVEIELQRLGKSRYYNENMEGKAVVLDPYGSNLQVVLDLLTQLPNPEQNFKRLYPIVRLDYARLYSKTVEDFRKNLFFQVALKYIDYGDFDLVQDFVLFLSDYANSLTERFHFKKGTLEYRMFDFLLNYSLKNPESIAQGFSKLLAVPYLEENVLERTEVISKKYPNSFEGFESVFKEMILRPYLPNTLQKSAMQILFRIHTSSAQKELLFLAEKGSPDISIMATSFLKKW